MLPELVRSVAHLARLELSDAELPLITRHLSAIVEYVNQLQAVNTNGVEPLAHPLDLHDVFRDDTPTPSLTAGQALANAPARRDDFYAVPAVLE